MAKTREEWNALIEAHATTVGLSTSSSASWLLLRDLAVTIAIIFEGILELFYTDVEYLLANKHAGTLRQLPAVIKAFQYGHSLTVDANGKLGYDVIDEAAQIVTQVSVKKTTGQINIKVAKVVAGVTVQLTAPERAALADYLDEFIGTGIDWALASLPNDVVTYALNLEYDTLFDKTILLADVATALDNFRLNFPFNAIFYKSQLIAAIRAVPGVVSVVVGIDMVLDDGDTIVTNLAEKQELPAGYFLYDVSSTITAIAAE